MTATNGLMASGGLMISVGSFGIGVPIIILGGLYFLGSKAVQIARGTKKSILINESREAVFMEQDLVQVSLINNQLNREGLKKLIDKDYIKQLAVTLLLVYEKKKIQAKGDKNYSKKTFNVLKQKLSDTKYLLEEAKSKSLEKLKLGTNKAAYIKKVDENFNKILKRVQEVVIRLKNNLTLTGVIFFASGLSNIPELQNIIDNINSKKNLSKEECINLIWIIATTEFLFKKQEKMQVNNIPEMNITQIFLKKITENICCKTSAEKSTANLSINFREADSNQYIPDPNPIESSTRQGYQNVYKEQSQHILLANPQNPHTSQFLQKLAVPSKSIVNLIEDQADQPFKVSSFRRDSVSGNVNNFFLKDKGAEMQTSLKFLSPKNIR